MKRLFPVFIIAVLLAATVPINVRAAPAERPQLDLINSLVAYWAFEESVNPRIDSVGNNDLTAEYSPSVAAGRVGNAIELNQDYLWILDNADVSIGAGQSFSIAGWVFLNSVASQQHIWDKWNVTGQEYLVFYNFAANRFAFYVSDVSSNLRTVVDTTAVTTGTWYFIVATYDDDAKTISISVNNNTPTSAAWTNGIRDGVLPFEMGWYYTGFHNWLLGRLDETGIWKRALTSDERTLLYNSGAGLTYPFGTPITVWQIGNYLIDGSAESWPYLNWPPYFPWSASSMFDVTRQTTWTYGGDTAPMCDSNFTMLRTSLGHSPYIEQEFMFYGGDMFVTMGLRTQGIAQMIIQIKDPFDAWSTVASFLTNGASNWKAFNYVLSDQWLGKYKLRVTAISMGAQSFAAVDGLSVGEGWYQPCDYNGTVLTPPSTMPGTLTQKASPVITDDTGNLISNSDLGQTGNEITDWYVSEPSYQHVSLPNSSGYLALFVNSAPIMTKTWIQTMAELPVADTLPAFKGFTPFDAFSVVARQFAISLFMTELAGDMSRIPLEVVNVDTGQRYDSFDFRSHDIFDNLQDPDIPLGWDSHLITIDVPPGRYRLVFGSSWPFPALPETTLYIDKVCVGGYGFIIAPDCTFSPEERLWINSDADYQNEQRAAAQATTIAGLTGTPIAATALALQTQVVGTQVAQAQATQTALVASGNQTQIALATSAQASALTATPRAALTGTAFVQQFRATLTQIAGATQTRAAQVVINNATDVALRTQQAQLQQTAWANATQSGQLTAQANYQATLNAQATAEVVLQPTVAIIQTNAAATQVSAATALATNSNATTQYQATQAVDYQATINAIATQQAQAQLTTIALLTAAPNVNATLQAQATQIAQQYATLIATYQALATQQVLEVPIVQPMPEDAIITADVDCTRPTNAINIPGWIDYEVCRILWFFTPNQHNVAQIDGAVGTLQAWEPFNTLNTIGGMYGDLHDEWEQYDWYTTGLEGAQDTLPQIVESDYATPPPGVLTLMQRATEVPLLYGNFDFNDPALNYAFATTCTLRISDLIGPYITPPICFLVDIFRTTGYLPLARILFDLGAIMLFIRYGFATVDDWLGEAKKTESIIEHQYERPFRPRK